MSRIKKLEMLGISKSFHGFYANRNVNLTIESGKVLGLLGENGAGKTTLMNILYGLYSHDEGEVKINNKPVKIKSPRDSISLGIGMVHQHFMLVQNHTVAENIALGSAESPFFFPLKTINKKIKEFSNKISMYSSLIQWKTIKFILLINTESSF